MPGISPRWARSRRQMRQIPNLRYTARGRPQKLQRVYARVENLGGRAFLAISDFFAMDLLLALFGVAILEGHAEVLEQGVGLLVRPGSCHERDVHTLLELNAIEVDLGEHTLLGEAH